jgi:hypothetical protein
METSTRGAESDASGAERRRGNDLVAPLVRDLLLDDRPVRLTVGGHSMTPFIRRGDVVTVQPTRLSRPVLGAVLVVAADAQRFTVHRHVGWRDGRIVPRGDCAPAPDPAIPLASVLGVVTRVERSGLRVWAGLGPERRVLAWLSRTGWLAQLARLRTRLDRLARRGLRSGQKREAERE